MGFFTDRLFEDEADDSILGEDPSDFHHSKRPGLKYLLKSQEQLTEEALRELEAKVEREER